MKQYTSAEFTSSKGLGGAAYQLRQDLAKAVGADLNAGEDVESKIILDVKSGAYWLPLAHDMADINGAMLLADQMPSPPQYRLRAVDPKRVTE